MANIPVERKRGMPGWAWLLIGLLLVLVLFLLFGDGCASDVDSAGFADTTSAVVDTTVGATGVTGGIYGGDGLDFTGPADLEGAGTLFTRADEGSIVGQTVRLTDVVAADVVGDSAFYVAEGARRVLVVLEGLGEAQAGEGCTDGRACVQEGDTLDVTGRVAALDEALRSRLTVPSSAAQDYYIRARRVDG